MFLSCGFISENDPNAEILDHISNKKKTNDSIEQKRSKRLSKVQKKRLNKFIEKKLKKEQRKELFEKLA
jgi:ATP-dependent RNA helicase DHX37/DHR1